MWKRISRNTYVATDPLVVAIAGIIVIAAVGPFESVSARFVRVAAVRALPAALRRLRESPAAAFATPARLLILRIVNNTTHRLAHATRGGSRIDGPGLHITASVQLSDNRELFIRLASNARERIFLTLTRNCTDIGLHVDALGFRVRPHDRYLPIADGEYVEVGRRVVDDVGVLGEKEKIDFRQVRRGAFYERKKIDTEERERVY